ncbi:hypothetical protein PVK06_044604 [Gossypium arboreum]|uniref:Uncharacterized protein n=1 Tax=Gossypium arboreum TaxID=29729 RepID=A0ABR0MU67_GOSAR|nr:hypothetical protein PVK06_044604 [Gossypium arboreum]
MLGAWECSKTLQENGSTPNESSDINGKDDCSGHSRNLLCKDKDRFEGVMEETRSWCDESMQKKDSNEGLEKIDAINKGQHTTSMGECVRAAVMENVQHDDVGVSGNQMDSVLGSDQELNGTKVMVDIKDDNDMGPSSSNSLNQLGENDRQPTINFDMNPVLDCPNTEDINLSTDKDDGLGLSNNSRTSTQSQDGSHRKGSKNDIFSEASVSSIELSSCEQPWCETRVNSPNMSARVSKLVSCIRVQFDIVL